jgi:hypothetical protein
MPSWDSVKVTKRREERQYLINVNKESKNKLCGTLIVPFGLAIILAPYSLVIGWNLMTMVVFWLLLTPALAIYLPTLASSNKNHLFESVSGMIIFYTFMVFMIYDHYKTDMFQFMIWSCVINLILVSFIVWVRTPETKA